MEKRMNLRTVGISTQDLAYCPLRTIVAEIASASMFIYLSHYMVLSLVTKIFGEKMPWIGFEIAPIVGIIFAHVYDSGDTKVRTMIKLRKFTFVEQKN
jgi:hypothetical protein